MQTMGSPFAPILSLAVRRGGGRVTGPLRGIGLGRGAIWWSKYGELARCRHQEARPGRVSIIVRKGSSEKARPP